MNLDISGKQSYQYLTLCIQEFEEAALKSGKRAGFLSVANGSTHAMDVVLDSQERSLNRVNAARQKLHPTSSGASAPPPQTVDVDGAGESKQPPGPIQLVDEDIDLMELFGNGDSKFANYLEDCIGCSLRLKFDWQLQPLNLLGPINGFLDQMNLALDKLLDRINPFKILEDICWALNHFKTLCPQDIILVLMGIKALLKKYLLQMFNIKLDWTVLLGPLLKALVSAITDLLDNIFALLMAPLDCGLAGLRAANSLLRASQDFIGSIQSAGAQVGNFFDTVKEDGFVNSTVDTQTSGLLGKDVSWDSPGTFQQQDGPFTPGSTGVSPGQLQVDTMKLSSPKPEDALRLPTGFVLTSNATLADALNDPSFPNATWLEKIIIPLQEAINWIKETFDKILGSLHSLEGLVGGGISLSLDNIGIMLFLTDIISLLLLIYKLITSNLGVKDWCSFLQKNPQVLENELNPRFNVDVTARGTGDSAELVLTQGPAQNQVGVIKTCVNSRTAADSDILANWVSQIEVMGAVA